MGDKQRKYRYSEADLERYLVDRVRVAGGIAYKFVSPRRASVPDRVVLLPGGVQFYAEVKAPGRRPTKLQAYEHQRMRKLGAVVVVVDSHEAIDKALNTAVEVSRAGLRIV